tara:strand:+ start:3703 stop:5142 length:1440 start_codon:yes stop_codon:yes gene_type:complete
MKEKPKISIITIVKNGMPFINDALKSFKSQTYKNKELIVVYTNSEDMTLNLLKSQKFIKKILIDNLSKNIYGSINIGLKHAEGDLIGILHSDDIFYDKNVLSNVIKDYKNLSFDLAYGDIIISKKNEIDKPLRLWKSGKFTSSKLKYGWMPPHTSIFISKKLKKNKYSTEYKVSADYDYLLKLFRKKIKINYLNYFTTIMRTGGISSKYLFLKFIEDNKILRKYYKLYFIVSVFKVIRKLNQFFFFSGFLKQNNFLKPFVRKRYKFINSANKILKEKNFVLSAFNMAFLSFVHNKISFNREYLYVWPDGILAKFLVNINKIPGRKILSNLKPNKSIKDVYLISSKNLKNIEYVKKKFRNNKFYFIDAPYGDPKDILKKIYKKIRNIRPNSLLLLGLPTPKQEIVASKILNMNENIKIICFGGAINYNSKDTKIPPKIFENYFESLWRLQTDTLRRSVRLFYSITIFLKRFLFGELKNLK